MLAMCTGCMTPLPSRNLCLFLFVCFDSMNIEQAFFYTLLLCGNFTKQSNMKSQKLIRKTASQEVTPSWNFRVRQGCFLFFSPPKSCVFPHSLIHNTVQHEKQTNIIFAPVEDNVLLCMER